MTRYESESHRRSVAVARLAARQHGVVRRRELEALGAGSSVIARWVRQGRLHRRHQGVYAVGHPLLSWHGRLLAATFACGSASWVSHRSAAALWELGPRVTVPEVVTTRSGVRSPKDVRLRRTERLHPGEVSVVERIPVTSVARTLADLAAVVSPRTLERSMERAESLRLLHVTDLLESAAGRPGAAAVRRVLDGWSPAPTRSEFERVLLEVVRSSTLPEPEVNARAGPFEVDQLWRSERVVVEADSRSFHATSAAFERDRRRDALLAARGYRVLRFTWMQATRRQGEVLGAIASALAAASVQK